MNNGRLYSGRQLAEHGCTKVESDFPNRGTKEVIASGTWLEQKQIQNALEERKSLLCERIEKYGNISQAEWIPEKQLARFVEKERRGSYTQFFGFPESGEYYLYPEEALHLLEVNCLLLRYCGVPVSLQQAYSLLIDNFVITLDEYRVYSNLSRKGYKVLRHKSNNNDKSVDMWSRSGVNITPENSQTEWQTLPLVLIGTVAEIQRENCSSLIQRDLLIERKKTDLENGIGNCNVVACDDDNNDCVIVRSKDSDCIPVDMDICSDVNDCVIVRSKDADCIPVETDVSVRMPNTYRKEKILIVVPGPELLPRNLKPKKASYKINIKSLSRRTAPRRCNEESTDFANNMFRQILQRQAYMANFWPPTYRHNCVPNANFNTVTNMFMDTLHNGTQSLQVYNHKRDPHSQFNRQIAQLQTLIEKFDLFGVRYTDREAIANTKQSIYDLIKKFNESYGENYTIESLRKTAQESNRSIIDLSSDSDGEGASGSKRKKRRTDDDVCEVSSTSDTAVSAPNQWFANEWKTKETQKNPHHVSSLYTQYLLTFTRKSKKSYRNWREVKISFEESIQKETINISDDEDGDGISGDKPVLLSLKTDKILPLIRPQDCVSSSTIMQRLSIIKNVKSTALKCDEYLNRYKISFDVFEPSVKYVKKQDLVTPLFRVVCLRITDPIPKLIEVTQLLKRFTDDVPVKWAVAGSNAVSFLQLGNVDIPTHCKDSTSNSPMQPND